jgi:hypothetical protein
MSNDEKYAFNCSRYDVDAIYCYEEILMKLCDEHGAKERRKPDVGDKVAAAILFMCEEFAAREFFQNRARKKD